MTELPFEIHTFGGLTVTYADTTTKVGGLLPQRLLGLLTQTPNTQIPDS